MIVIHTLSIMKKSDQQKCGCLSDIDGSGLDLFAKDLFFFGQRVHF